jgi:3-hydroxybutyryl-CoA dehydrogenase
MGNMTIVFVVGAGVMGGGIAQACAQAGCRVALTDADGEALKRAVGQIGWSLGKLSDAGKLSEEKDTILGRIVPTQDYSAAEEADLAIEAVYEALDVKCDIFRRLDRVCGPRTILASNTSAIPITDIAASTDRAEQVVGLHFFNPAPLMQVVEVVAGIAPSDETMRRAVDFVRSLGKEPIRVETDIPGFLLNRINLVSYVEAIRLVEQRVGTIAEIDRGVRIAFGRRMGPFETGDLVGLDVSFGALSAIYEESKDARYYPPQLLRRMVKAGRLGRKTGRGWYEYDDKGNRR